jgi:hypothetical protein
MSIFHCATRFGHNIKSLASYLNVSVRSGSLNISRDGIKIVNMDSHKRILVDCYLDGKYFDKYELNCDQLCININFFFFEKILKSLKKTDHIELSIDKEVQILSIKIIPRDRGRISEMEMAIESGQSLDIDVPDNYSHFIMIHSNEVQQLCKEIKNTISTTSCIDIKLNQFNSKINQLVLSWKSNMILNKCVKFCNDSIENMEMVELYNEEFNPNAILNISKLVNINRQLFFYLNPNLPLKISLRIEDLCRINIFIKTNKNLEEDDDVDSD